MKGIYLLRIVVERSQEIRVGSRGRIAFPAGSYVYVGSAQNGLEERIARHLRKRKKCRWHIDYLLSARGVRADRVLYAAAGRSKECEVAALLAAQARPVKGFGSSDCACPGHLFAVTGAAFFGSQFGGLRWQAAGRGAGARASPRRVRGASDQVWPAAMPPAGEASAAGRALITLRPKYSAVCHPRSVRR